MNVDFIRGYYNVIQTEEFTQSVEFLLPYYNLIHELYGSPLYDVHIIL